MAAADAEDGLGTVISTFLSEAFGGGSTTVNGTSGIGRGENGALPTVGRFSAQWRENNPDSDSVTLNNESHTHPAARFSAVSHKRRSAYGLPAGGVVVSDDGFETVNDTPPPAKTSEAPVARTHKPHPKLKMFETLLQEPRVDLVRLRKLAWNGIPRTCRAMTWKLLLGYLPSVSSRRASSMEEKREKYWNAVAQFYGSGETMERSEYEAKIFHQVSIDVPRTNPNLALFQLPQIHEVLQRVLYVWAVRHPASGYVQGINDLATPFLCVFLQSLISPTECIEQATSLEISSSKLKEVEADVYWCLTKFIDCIQDNYSPSQPGIQRMLYRLEELVRKIDAPLHMHFNQQKMQFIQFAFRWMNCLLMRELPLDVVYRVWDTYLAEDSRFSSLHVFLCAAFLENFSVELMKKDFPGIITFLQRPPTSYWTDVDVEPLLAQAYVWMTMYNDAPGHLH